MTTWLSPQNSAWSSSHPRHESQFRSGREGIQDRADVGRVAEQVVEEPISPRFPGTGQVRMVLAPDAALRVHLEDHEVWVEQARVDQGDEREDVPTAVLDVEHHDGARAGHPLPVDGDGDLGRPGDDQVEGNRDGPEAIEDVVDEFRVVHVQHHRHASRRTDRDVVAPRQASGAPARLRPRSAQAAKSAGEPVRPRMRPA